MFVKYLRLIHSFPFYFIILNKNLSIDSLIWLTDCQRNSRLFFHCDDWLYSEKLILYIVFFCSINVTSKKHQLNGYLCKLLAFFTLLFYLNYLLVNHDENTIFITRIYVCISYLWVLLLFEWVSSWLHQLTKKLSLNLWIHSLIIFLHLTSEIGAKDIMNFFLSLLYFKLRNSV